jgi:hypothetical protein
MEKYLIIIDVYTCNNTKQMKYTLIIDNEKEEAQLIISQENEDEYEKISSKTEIRYIYRIHRLRKWDNLIDRFDREFGTKTYMQEDAINYSYKTIEYLNLIRIHTEPTEFLIDIMQNNMNTSEEDYKKNKEMNNVINHIIRSAGYKIRYYDSLAHRFFVEVPY